MTAEQYKNSGPKPSVSVDGTDKINQKIDVLEETVQKQTKLIEELQTEIRRLKSKLDRHADYLNRRKDG